MAALGGRQIIGFQFLDASGEVKTTSVFANEITALSLPGLLTNISALQAALVGVTLGVISKTSFGNEEVLSNTPPVNKAAQIETQMLVRARGATSQAPYSFRLYTVDYTKFNYASPPAGDQVILAGAGATAETIALVAALQAIGKMPNDETEAIVIVGMEIVR